LLRQSIPVRILDQGIPLNQRSGVMAARAYLIGRETGREDAFPSWIIGFQASLEQVCLVLCLVTAGFDARACGCFSHHGKTFRLACFSASLENYLL
jgi:hypothetical protein